MSAATASGRDEGADGREARALNGRNGFADRHPLVALAFFAWVLALTMCLMHPLSLLCSLAGALCCAFALYGRALGRTALRCLPLALLAAAVNVAFNHAGVTILAYFPSGNPLTAESIAFGLAAAVMLFAVLVWFSCCAAVLTEDKLLYLFSRVSPTLGLLLSMTLRFVPRFRDRMRAAREMQRAMGENGVRAAVRAFSATVTWALESSVETADSMRRRGYGLQKRTAFLLYRMSVRDGRLLLWLMACGGIVVLAALQGALRWRYFPYLSGAGNTPWGIAGQAAFAALCLTPAVLSGKEALYWKRFASMN